MELGQFGLRGTRSARELLVPVLSNSGTGWSKPKQETKIVEEQGIDPCASRMLSERSTI
jgi:hypothetical protein